MRHSNYRHSTIHIACASDMDWDGLVTHGGIVNEMVSGLHVLIHGYAAIIDWIQSSRECVQLTTIITSVEFIPNNGRRNNGGQYGKYHKDERETKIDRCITLRH